ncbi:MAG: STM3941 family protein [Labrenzia sp.]
MDPGNFKKHNFHYVKAHLIKKILIGFTMFILGSIVLFDSTQKNTTHIIPAIVGLILSTSMLLLTVYYCRFLLNISSPILEISEQGICDHRSMITPIPWSEITHISARGASSVLVVLNLTCERYKKHFPRKRHRYSRAFDRMLGIKGPYVSLSGLDLAPLDIVKLIEAYHESSKIKAESAL